MTHSAAISASEYGDRAATREQLRFREGSVRPARALANRNEPTTHLAQRPPRHTLQSLQLQETRYCVVGQQIDRWCLLTGCAGHEAPCGAQEAPGVRLGHRAHTLNNIAHVATNRVPGVRAEKLRTVLRQVAIEIERTFVRHVLDSPKTPLTVNTPMRTPTGVSSLTLGSISHTTRISSTP